MQKSMKRLLSVLAVLALVLTMAPAGILAVETKAEVQSAVPTDVATKMATEQAKQAAAVAALESLTGTTEEERLVELNEVLPVCPFCGNNVTWTTPAENATQYGSTSVPHHRYIYGDHSMNVGLMWHMSADNAKQCLLLDDANVTGTGRILFNKAGAVLNIGGKGTIRSDMSALNTSLGTTQNGVFYLMNSATLNLYGGNFINDCNATVFSDYTGFNRSLVHVNAAGAVVNVWTDDVVLGPEAPATSAKMNVRVQAGTVNMYGGTIQNAYTAPGWSQGWNVFIQSGNFNMYGGTVKDGNGSTAGVGGNVHLYSSAGRFSMYGGTLTGGTATYGGNLYVVANATANVYGGLIEKGTCTAQGGNISVHDGATLNLGNVDIKGGVAPATASLSSNVRLWNGATLKLSGNANCGGSILMTGTEKITVEPTFTGEVYVWHTGGVTMGGAVANSTATGGHTGHVYNGAWKSAVAANGASDVYIPVEMVWDGATGLEYPTNGVVYNGSLRGTANAQAAVDAYVAAMADEEAAKPQYVMINADVNIGENEVVIDPLDDIIVYGSGTVYGVDRANDTYAATAGSITVAGPAVAAEVTAGGRHFIALEDASAADKYTFHRMEAALTNVTVNKDNAGMYYKAQYKFDAKVAAQVASYGVLVKLNEAVNAENYANKTTATDAATAYDAETATLTAKSHGVYGIFKTTNEAAVNVANGNTKLFGNPYIMIGDEMFTAAESTGMSLADAMVRANTVWEKMSEEDQANLNAFVSEWKALNAWSEDVLELLDNFTIA